MVLLEDLKSISLFQESLLVYFLFRFQKMPNGSLVIHDVSMEDTGSYTCIAGNSCNIAHTSAELYVVGEADTFLFSFPLLIFWMDVSFAAPKAGLLNLGH